MRIVLVTDSHLRPTNPEREANWRAARDFTARSQVDLTIHLGDITADAFNAPEELAHAQALLSDWPTSMRLLPGNHDIGDNPPGPDVPSTHPLAPALLAEYRARFGPDCWAVALAGWWVIALNAQLFGLGTAHEHEQWDWLESRVADAAGRPVLLLIHKPLFQTGPEDAVPHIRYVPLLQRRRLLALLAPLDLRLVVSGHTHQHLDRVIDGVRHLWLPATSYCFPEAMQERVGEKIVGLGLLELEPDRYRFDLVCPEGMQRRDYQRVSSTAPA